MLLVARIGAVLTAIALAACEATTHVERFEVPDATTTVIPLDMFERFVITYGLAVDQTANADCGTFRGMRVSCKGTRAETDEARDIWGPSPLPFVATPPLAAPLPAISERLGVIGEADASGALADLGRITAAPSISADYGWVGIASVVSGPEVLARWRHLARKRTVFNCGATGACSQLVFAFTTALDVSVDAIAVCSVRRISKLQGAPSQCQLVAVGTGENARMLAAIGYRFHSYALAGRTDFCVLFTSAENERHQRLVASADDIFRDVLRKPPFSLEVTGESGDLVGSVDFAYFAPLESRALQTIRFSRQGNTGHHFCVATTLYVSKQKSDDPREWHRPSQSQETAYTDIVRERLEGEMRQRCPDMHWVREYRNYEVTCPP